jgi:hypothetical protein
MVVIQENYKERERIMHIPDRATSTRSRTPILFYLVAKTVVELK